MGIGLLRRSSRDKLTAAAVGITVGVVLASAVGALAAGTGTIDPPPRIAFVARSDVAADALAAGPVAGRFGAVLFTTPPTVLADEARAGLAAFAPHLVVIAGGTAAVSEEVELAILQATGLPADKIVRAAGDNRHHTAALLAGLVEQYAPAFLPVDATAVDSTHLGGHPASQYPRTATVTGHASCSHAAFLPDGNFDDIQSYTTLDGPSLGSATAVRVVRVEGLSIKCAIELPDGARVVGLRVLVFDNHDAKEVAGCGLVRGPARPGAAAESVMAETGGTGPAATPGLTERSTTSIDEPVVDLANYHYWVACELGAYNPAEFPQAVGIAGATVEYRLVTVPTRTP